MSLDKSRENLLDVRDLAINSILFALESNPEITSANYNSQSETFCVNTAEGSFSFKLVFPGEIAGHA